MYLTKSEREIAVSAYGFKNLVEDDHYQVDYDVWVYLFHDENNKKYVLIVADCIDYYYDVFPHPLKFDYGFKKIEFVLQRELPIKDENLLMNIHANTILFEYTD